MPNRAFQSAARPDVTIGMVVRNGAPYLRRAIASLRAQTYGNFILILSDNASTDDTATICREVAAQDSRITYLRHATDIGPIANFWSVLDRAHTPYFMWAGHDDWWEPTFIECLRAELQADADVGLAFCWVKVVHPDSRQLLKTFQPAGSSGGSPLKNYIAELIYPCVNKYYGLYRTEVLKKFEYRKCSLYDYQDNLVVDHMNLHARTAIVPRYLFNYSEVPDKRRTSLDPRLRALARGLTKRFYHFNHLAYIHAGVVLILRSELSWFAKPAAAVSFFVLFGWSKLRLLIKTRRFASSTRP